MFPRLNVRDPATFQRLLSKRNTRHTYEAPWDEWTPEKITLCPLLLSPPIPGSWQTAAYDSHVSKSQCTTPSPVKCPASWDSCGQPTEGEKPASDSIGDSTKYPRHAPWAFSERTVFLPARCWDLLTPNSQYLVSPACFWKPSKVRTSVRRPLAARLSYALLPRDAGNSGRLIEWLKPEPLLVSSSLGQT